MVEMVVLARTSRRSAGLHCSWTFRSAFGGHARTGLSLCRWGDERKRTYYERANNRLHRKFSFFEATIAGTLRYAASSAAITACNHLQPEIDGHRSRYKRRFSGTRRSGLK